MAKINTTLIRQRGIYNVFPIGFNLYKKYKLIIYTTNTIYAKTSPLVTGSCSIVIYDVRGKNANKIIIINNIKSANTTLLKTFSISNFTLPD